MDARDLVLKEDIRNYWKENGIFTDPDDQLKLILRAYCSIETKIKYLEDFVQRFGNLSVRDTTVQEIIDYYRRSVKFIFDPDSQNQLKLFFMIEMEEAHNIDYIYQQRFYDSYEFPSIPYYYFSLNDMLNEYIETKELDYVIYCTVIDTKSKKELTQYCMFLIKGEISFIFEFHNNSWSHKENSENDIISKSIFDFSATFSYTNDLELPLFPYKNNTKVSLQTTNMEKPLVKYLYDDIDANGTNYCYFVNRKVKNDKDYILSFGIMNYSITFKLFYNYYDWIKEERKTNFQKNKR